ncbi:acrosin isoform X2 [Parasteatoda tepidariorum]|uniref:acrosin isoform X2 n=1 Tax=Parasteatoda tepidariorum TaxID=114398 RepID=UPI001C718896|nr:transmembrane protease serine 9 isoform X2 [Parasteatoda tepidariorum]
MLLAKLLLLAGLCIALLENTYAEEFNAVFDRIVGGRKAKENEFPWMASLQVRTSSGLFHTCGAVLITKEWLVTAAHCIKKLVLLVYMIDTIVIKSDFNAKNLDNDICLIQITPPVTKPMDFLLLSNDPPEVNNSAIVIGWGSLSEEEKTASNDLQAAVVGMISFDECLHYFSLTDSMMCAGYIPGGIDACQGDSGGPLLQWRNEEAYLIGIVSWGVGCAKPNAPGVYTNISFYKSWILRYVNPGIV